MGTPYTMIGRNRLDIDSYSLKLTPLQVVERLKLASPVPDEQCAGLFFL